jgi:hypothetical protein
MARSEKKKDSGKENGSLKGRSTLVRLWRNRGVRGLLHVTMAAGVCVGVAYALGVLEAYVKAQGPIDPPVRLTLCDVPESYRGRAASEVLVEAQAGAQSGWGASGLVEEIGRRVSSVGWVKRVQRVEKLHDGRVLIRCDYRFPAAMVESGRKYYLVDEEGVRLPGEYVHDPKYRLVTGVAASAPAPGAVWPGEDVQAGLAMLNVLSKEAFWKQVAGVSVSNFRGRADSRASHIEVVTVAAGSGRVAGRIRWGSALGQEIEEPTVEEKLAILRANYGKYARIDCDQMWIDVSAKRGSYLYPDSTSALAPEAGERR